MNDTTANAPGMVRILRDAAGVRTTYEEIEIGKDLGSEIWTPTQAQIDQVCERMEDHHPYYEVGSPFGSTVVPVSMTYLLTRGLFSQTYSVRGLFYKWSVDLLEPICPGVSYTVRGRISDKWIRNDREFVAYESECCDPDGVVVSRTRRAHVMDYIKRTAPKVGEGGLGTSDARSAAARSARQPYWDPDWPAHDTAAGTGGIEVAPLAGPQTPIGARLPSNALYFSQQKFAKRQNYYFVGRGPTLHHDARAAQQEGLPAPVASAPDLMALCHQSAMQFFGAGWIRGGRAQLTSLRPTYAGEYIMSQGVVTAREAPADGAVRLHCDVWVINQKGEKKVAGTVSGLVAPSSR